jgi:FixJ family two-component response regulator
MSGDQLLDRLRLSRPGLKALLVSGYVDVGYAARLERDTRARRIHFLAKPFNPDDIVARVGAALESD